MSSDLTSPPALSPTVVAVWGIESESLDALEILRDFQPSPMSDLHAFLWDCQNLAMVLLTSANLKDQNETNASAVLRLQSSLGEVQVTRDQRDADVVNLTLRVQILSKGKWYCPDHSWSLVLRQPSDMSLSTGAHSRTKRYEQTQEVTA